MNKLFKNVAAVLPGFVRHPLLRSIYHLRHGKWLFKPYIINKTMEGESFCFLIGDRTGRDWYDRECINNPRWLEMRFMRDQVVQKGDVILECGGHHGCSAILLSRWVGPTGKVITFEPFPSNCEILEKNISLNKIANIVLEKKAVGANNGVIFIDEPLSAVSPNGEGEEVAVIKLDEYQYLNPTLLKIDVEGFELDVLKGAVEILKTRPKLEIEIHAELLGEYGASIEEIYKIIGIENYKVWVQWADDQIPVEFDVNMPISHRAHLFCLPK
jgi:FkbM family methyltransferase